MECGCNPAYYGPYLATGCGGGSFLLFMGLVDAIIRNTCDISDICGRMKPKTEPDLQYDFIVIGGGSGGSTVAGRLAEQKHWNTLLIEAGIDEPESYQIPAFVNCFGSNPLTDWNYRTSNEPLACAGTNHSCMWPRAKMLGGCSTMNGMMFTRGTPADFDLRWQGAGINGWSWNDVLPFFRKSEGNRQFEQYDGDYHGQNGPMTVSNHYYIPEFANALLQGAKESGFPITNDLNGVNHTGFGIPQSFVSDGLRVSMAKAYLRPHRNNENLHIMLNSTVTKILVNANKKAYAVEFIYNNRTYTVKAKKEIILSAGTMDSPKILLQSGIGPKDALNAVGIKQIHDLPGVGQNLTNHVAITMTFDVKNLPDTMDTVTYKTIQEYLDHRGGPLASPGVPVTARLPSSVKNASDPDIQLYFQLTSHVCTTTGESNVPADPKNPSAVKTLSITPLYLHTKSRGRITLKSNNPLDPPVMVGNYLTVKEDEDRLIDAVRLVQKLVNSPTLKNKWGVTSQNSTYGNCSVQYTLDSDDYWRCSIRHSTYPENHQCSTLKMGPISDKWTVLDEKLRVIGISHLRVADASVMPVVTSSNTNAPIVMIGERAADFIIRTWG